MEYLHEDEKQYILLKRPRYSRVSKHVLEELEEAHLRRFRNCKHAENEKEKKFCEENYHGYLQEKIKELQKEKRRTQPNVPISYKISHFLSRNILGKTKHAVKRGGKNKTHKKYKSKNN